MELENTRGGVFFIERRTPGEVRRGLERGGLVWLAVPGRGTWNEREGVWIKGPVPLIRPHYY